MSAPFRLTTQTRLLLSHLLNGTDGDNYGFEISKATGLKPGTLYPTLARLEKAGWIEGRWESIDPGAAGRPVRRYYRLTGLGITNAVEITGDATRSDGVERLGGATGILGT